MLELQGKYNTAKVFTDNIEQEAIGQIINLMNYKAFSDAKIRIMSDTHAGKSCVIGFTASNMSKIVPAIVGVDINCGMLLVNLGKVEIDLPKLDNFIRNNIPHGSNNNKKVVAIIGDDLEQNIGKISKKLGKDKSEFFNGIGSLGGGNHFISIDTDNNHNKYLTIHCGSRNFGYRLANYHQKQAEEYCQKKSNNNKIDSEVVQKLRDSGKFEEIESYISSVKNNNIYRVPKELSFLEGELLEQYLCDIKVAGEYAKLNRETIASRILEYLNLNPVDQFHTVHNYIDSLGVVRKGSIRASLGEKVLIPLNMRDGSIIGIGKGNEDYNNSAPHGSGRVFSRSKAKEVLDLEEFKNTMSNIYSTSVSKNTLDESPMAYKPSEEIINSLRDTVDILEIIKPIYNFKSH